MKEWIIKERLSHKEIMFLLNKLNDTYKGYLFRHKKSDELYRIEHFSILNENNSTEIAVNYTPIDNYNIKFTKPAREFFDGRFQDNVIFE